MLRTIIFPGKNSVTLELPDDLVGKKVEVIAFAIDEAGEIKTNSLKPSSMRGFLSLDLAGTLEKHIEKNREEWDTF